MTDTPRSAPIRPAIRPAAVSRALAKALAPRGIYRAEAEATSVRGWYRYSPGFEVFGGRLAYEAGLAESPEDTDVFVTAQCIDDQTRYLRPGDAGYEAHHDREYRILGACQEVLDAIGYVWVRTGSRGRDHLRITGRR